MKRKRIRFDPMFASWTGSVPINDPVTVKELQGQRHLGRVETSSRLVKLPDSLDLKHEIATVDVFHDEEQAILRVKNGRLKHKNRRAEEKQKAP